eukprot:4157407-Heterocapsa_arctica.AAC.1
MFYRDYGNETYGQFLRKIATKGYDEGNITRAEHDSIAKFNNVNMGNILEAVMGYAWIYNYKNNPDLAEAQDILNCLETGIQTMLKTEETTKLPDAEEDDQDEPMSKNKMTEEEATKIAEIMNKILKPDLLRIGNIGEHREQHRRKQGDVRDLLQGHRQAARTRTLLHQGETPGYFQ